MSQKLHNQVPDTPATGGGQSTVMYINAMVLGYNRVGHILKVESLPITSGSVPQINPRSADKKIIDNVADLGTLPRSEDMNMGP